METASFSGLRPLDPPGSIYSPHAPNLYSSLAFPEINVPHNIALILVPPPFPAPQFEMFGDVNVEYGPKRTA